MPIELNPTQALVYTHIAALHQEYLPTVAEISHTIGLSYSCVRKNMQELVQLGLLLREKSTYSKAYYYRLVTYSPVGEGIVIVPFKERLRSSGPANWNTAAKFGY